MGQKASIETGNKRNDLKSGHHIIFVSCPYQDFGRPGHQQTLLREYARQNAGWHYALVDESVAKMAGTKDVDFVKAWKTGIITLVKELHQASVIGLYLITGGGRGFELERCHVIDLVRDLRSHTTATLMIKYVDWTRDADFLSGEHMRVCVRGAGTQSANGVYVRKAGRLFLDPVGDHYYQHEREELMIFPFKAFDGKPKGWYIGKMGKGPMRPGSIKYFAPGSPDFVPMTGWRQIDKHDKCPGQQPVLQVQPVVHAAKFARSQ